MPNSMRPAVWLALALLFASAAHAADPVAPSNTAWLGPAQIKAKIPGAGSSSGPVDFEFLFGPNGGAGLDANEFHLIADDGMVAFDVFGTYTTDAKGQPVLAPDTVLLADELKIQSVHVCEGILGLGAGCDEILTLDVIVDSSRLKLKVKASAGNGSGATLALSAKIPFVLTDGVDEAKVTISLKTSPPAELVK